MVRAPCCDSKMGLKKGPWTPEEDRILVSYIQNNGHGNWRALPKLSGLLRCGKSCRLRWINYLRPDIKRGNFTKEEEETIIELHQMLGNRWSTIAAKLPGRTDNEIKNVWHTHLKKRLKLKNKLQSSTTSPKPEPEPEPEPSSSSLTITAVPQPCLSETSLMTEASNLGMVGEVNNIENVIDESFWSDPLLLSGDLSGWLSGSNDITLVDSSSSMDGYNGELITWDPSYTQVIDEGMEMDFWYNLFAQDDHGGHKSPEFSGTN